MKIQSYIVVATTIVFFILGITTNLREDRLLRKHNGYNLFARQTRYFAVIDWEKAENYKDFMLEWKSKLQFWWRFFYIYCLIYIPFMLVGAYEMKR